MSNAIAPLINFLNTIAIGMVFIGIGYVAGVMVLKKKISDRRKLAISKDLLRAFIILVMILFLAYVGTHR